MTIALLVTGVVAIAWVTFEIAGSIVARHAKERFDKMPPDEQRKEQERLYKAHQ